MEEILMLIPADGMLIQENVRPLLKARPEMPGYHININRKTNNSEFRGIEKKSKNC